MSNIIEGFETLHWEQRLEEIFRQFDPEQVLVTSSFGTSSAILLHMLSKVRPEHPVYFLDTGYHFEETIRYKNQLIEQFGLRVIDVHPDVAKHAVTRAEKTYQSKPDLCCLVNKVAPMEPLKANHKIWLSGLFKYQNANRENFQFFEQKKDILKCYPLLDMSPDEVKAYYYLNEIPEHPLIPQGYDSVGCTHCTSKGKGREGRWAGLEKTECGIHL